MVSLLGLHAISRVPGTAASNPFPHDARGGFATPSGNGLWLPFGTASSTTSGYALVARDGGIFDFGDPGFFGSLPGLGLDVSDVVGVAPTPSGHGYWIVRSGGQVYPFGNAKTFRGYTASGCDRVVAIIGNPLFQGYRLVTRSGATFSFGAGVGGAVPTGRPATCPT